MEELEKSVEVKPKKQVNPKSLLNLRPGRAGKNMSKSKKRAVAILQDLIDQKWLPGNIKNIQDLQERAIAIQWAMMYSGDNDLMVEGSKKIIEYTHAKGVNLSGQTEQKIVVEFALPPAQTKESLSSKEEVKKVEAAYKVEVPEDIIIPNVTPFEEEIINNTQNAFLKSIVEEVKDEDENKKT